MRPGVIVVRRYSPLVGGRLPYAAFPPLIDAQATATDSNTVSLTVTERVTGAKRKLIVQASYEAPSGTQTVTGITYGGVPLTHVVSGYDPATQRNRVEFWYLDAPAVGTANVVVTWSGGGTGGVVAHSLYYAAQGAPDANASGGADSGTTLAVNITPTAVDALVIDGIDQASSTTSVAPAAGQTEVYDAAITGNSRIAGSYIVINAPATRSMSWTVTSGRGGIAAVAIAPDYTLTGSTFTGTGGLTAGGAAAAGTGTHVAPTFSASGALTPGGAAAAGTATHTAPTFSATGTLTVGGAAGAGTATHVAPTFSATGALTAGGAAVAGTALFATAIFSATGALVAGGPAAAGTGTHVPPTFSGSGAATAGGAAAAGAATATGPLFSATGAMTAGGAATASVGTYSSGTFTATGAASVGAAAAGSAAHVPPTFTGTGVLAVAGTSTTAAGLFYEDGPPAVEQVGLLRVHELSGATLREVARVSAREHSRATIREGSWR